MVDRQALSMTFGGGMTRRQALRTAGAGFGYVALAAMLGRAAPRTTPGPLAPRAPHFPARAKRIIFLFMEGAPSQLDLWEYKPRLQQESGRPGPGGGILTG